MPFRSRAQQGYLFATNPALAREFAKETKDYASLPDKITDSDPQETRRKPKPAWKPKTSPKPSRAKAAALTRLLGLAGAESDSSGAPPFSRIGALAARVFAEEPLQKHANRESQDERHTQFPPPATAEDMAEMSEMWRKAYARQKVAARRPWSVGVQSTLTDALISELRRQPEMQKLAFVTATPQSTSVPMQQAQAAMGRFMPQRPPQRELGLPSLASGGPQTGLPVGGQKAPVVPGMAGTAAANPIDMHGPLDPTGLALDGNHASGVRKGFKMAADLCTRLQGGAVDQSTRRLAPALLAKLAVDQSTRLPQEEDRVDRSTAQPPCHTATEPEKEQCDREKQALSPADQAKQLAASKASGLAKGEYCQGCGAVHERGEEGRCNSCGCDHDTGKEASKEDTKSRDKIAAARTQLQKLAAVLTNQFPDQNLEQPPASQTVQAGSIDPPTLPQGDPAAPVNQAAPPRRAVIVKGNPQFIDGNPAADAFYGELEAMLRQQGYGDVAYDAGAPYTEPPQADLWLGHSRGADRLRFAPEGTATIALGSKAPGAINHPQDDLDTPFHEVGGAPPDAHYQLSEDMRNELFTKLSAVDRNRFAGVRNSSKVAPERSIGERLDEATAEFMNMLGAAYGKEVCPPEEAAQILREKSAVTKQALDLPPVGNTAVIGKPISEYLTRPGGLLGPPKGGGTVSPEPTVKATQTFTAQPKHVATGKPVTQAGSYYEQPPMPAGPALGGTGVGLGPNASVAKNNLLYANPKSPGFSRPMQAMQTELPDAQRAVDVSYKPLAPPTIGTAAPGDESSFMRDDYGYHPMLGPEHLEKSNAFKFAFSLNPFAADPEEEKRRRSKATLPWMGIGLGAAGAGAYGLAKGIASDKQVQRVQDAAKNYDPRAFTDPKHLPPNRTGLTYYQETLSPAAQLNPFGKPVGESLVALRSDPDLMEFLGTQPYALLDEKAQNGVGGLAHYKAFANGPVPAYVHQLKARLHGTPVPENLGAPAGTMYSDWMGRRFEDFVANETGQRINPFEVDTKFMPHEDQLALMQKFHASLSPEEQAFRLQAEDPGPGYATQTSNYLPKAEALVDSRNFLQDVGIGLGGAGLGAVGGHILYDVLRDKKDKDKSWLGQTLASTAGAGLGGGLAYLAGTDSGRELAGSWLRALKRGVMGLPKQADFLESPEGYAAASRVMGVAA